MDVHDFSLSPVSTKRSGSKASTLDNTDPFWLDDTDEADKDWVDMTRAIESLKDYHVKNYGAVKVEEVERLLAKAGIHAAFCGNLTGKQLISTVNWENRYTQAKHTEASHIRIFEYVSFLAQALLPSPRSSHFNQMI